MLPVVSLITYRARFCLISFAIKTQLLLHRKRSLLYILMKILTAKMAALKVGILNQETESRNGIQISMIEKYYIKIPWHWNAQNKDNSFMRWQSNLHWHKWDNHLWVGSRNSIYPSLSGQSSACVNDTSKCCNSHQEIHVNKKIIQKYNFLKLQFVVKLWTQG